jgi:U3 small nucleolar RNA-associated protein 22
MIPDGLVFFLHLRAVNISLLMSYLELILSSGSFDSSFSIRIIPSLSHSSPIPLNRVSPTHCSIRPPNVPQVPTPRYSSILALLTLPKSLLLLTNTLSTEVPSFTDTIRLLKVWAAQRGYTPSSSNKDSLSTSSWGIWGFESGRSILWSCLIGALILGEDLGSEKKTLKGKLKPVLQVGQGLSSYQLFRAVMDLLGKVLRYSTAIVLNQDTSYS